MPCLCNFPTGMDCNQELCAEINPFPSSCCLLGHFIKATEIKLDPTSTSSHDNPLPSTAPFWLSPFVTVNLGKLHNDFGFLNTHMHIHTRTRAQGRPHIHPHTLHTTHFSPYSGHLSLLILVWLGIKPRSSGVSCVKKSFPPLCHSPSPALEGFAYLLNAVCVCL